MPLPGRFLKVHETHGMPRSRHPASRSFATLILSRPEADHGTLIQTGESKSDPYDASSLPCLDGRSSSR